MLNLSLTQTGINNEGTLLYLQDTTEWESPEQRVQYNLFLDANLKRTDEDVFVTDVTETQQLVDYTISHNGVPVTQNLVPVEHVPISALDYTTNNGVVVLNNGQVVTNGNYVHDRAVASTDYTVGLDNDGYYEFRMLAVSAYLPNPGEYGTDLEGNIVFNDGTDFVLKTMQELIDDPMFSDWVILRTLVINRLVIYTNNKYLEYFNEVNRNFMDEGHVKEIAYIKNGLDYAKSALAGVQYVWELDNYTGAQSIIENIECLWEA